MGFSAETTCYVATFVFCLFLLGSFTDARKILSQDPLLEELCSDLQDGDEVRVYARPVDEVGEEGTPVDVCKALEWSTGFLQEDTTQEKGPKKGSVSTQISTPSVVNLKPNKKGQQLEFVDDEEEEESPVDCSDPDTERAMVTTSIPESKNTCDITKEFPAKPKPSDEVSVKGLICWPPPFKCSATTTGSRRLMQSSKGSSGVDISIDCTTSSESSGSVGKSDENGEFDTSDACDESSVSIQIIGSVGSEGSEETDEPDPPLALTREAAVTVCKGQCCVTTVVSGAMYERIFDVVSTNS
ncbi:hypothetical protein BSKO_04525 [Bryopsis sp. KO-2023]|nr:hypothetical protein BSKO_04525 [Bryopsis sp. KO-2023]